MASETANQASIEKALGGSLIKLPTQYGLDWALVNPARSNTVERWVELKARSNEISKYSTYSISVKKVMRALDLEQSTGIPSILVVRFSDAVYTTYFKRFLERPVVIRIGGRSDRGDPEDQEPMWHLPVEKLHRLTDAVPGGEAVKIVEGREGEKSLP